MLRSRREEPVGKLGRVLVLADQRVGEERLPHRHDIARDGGLGGEPLVRGDVLDEPEELRGERPLRERLRPVASDAGRHLDHVVDTRNAGTLAGLADDDVVELPASVTHDGPEPLPQAPLAPELLGLVQHVAAYERLAARAAVSGDPVDAKKALLAHPLVGQDELSEKLLERLAGVAETAS